MNRWWPFVGLLTLAPWLTAGRMTAGMWLVYLVFMGLGPWAFVTRKAEGSS